MEACWSKVITERQQVLEEAYKMEMSASHRAQTGPVSMGDISPLWEEMAHKAWLLHIGQSLRCGEKRACQKSGLILLILTCLVYCAFSESQKKMLSSSVRRKFDMISSSSAAPSDLDRQGRESVKMQVNTRSPSLHSQATKDTSM